MNNRISIGMLSVVGLLASPAKAEEKKVELSEVPAAVKAAIEANSQGQTVEEIELETEDGKQVYSIEFKAGDGKEREIEVSPEGKLLKTDASDDGDAAGDDDDKKETKIDPATAPRSVQEAIKPHLGGAKIDAMTRETEDGKAVYEAEYMENGLENSVEVSEEGKVLEIEKGVSLSNLSAAVRDAAKARFPNGTLKVAERVEKPGEKTSSYYELKIQDNGKTHELKVDASGKVLSAEEDD